MLGAENAWNGMESNGDFFNVFVVCWMKLEFVRWDGMGGGINVFGWLGWLGVGLGFFFSYII